MPVNAATLSLPADRAAPRKRVLFALGAGVLLAHLSLLSGGFSGLSLDRLRAPASDPAPSPEARTPPAAEQVAAAPPDERPPPVSTSRVRWILPQPPEPEPEPPPPPPPPPPPKVVEPPPPPVEAKTETAIEVVEIGPTVEPPPVVDVVVTAPAEPPAPALVAAPPAAVAEPAPDLPAATAAPGTAPGQATGLADTGLPPATPPPGAELRFAVTSLSKGKTYNGSAQLTWSQDGRRYGAQLTVSVLFFTVLSQTSQGFITDKGLAPERFTDQRRRSERAALFDREGQRVRFSNNAPDARLLPGAQDWLSVNFQLASLFNARPGAQAEGQSVRLPVSSVDEAEVWLFQVGSTTLESWPAGDLQAVRLTRMPRKAFDKKVEVWLLPAHAHLPGRIRITDPNQDYLDLVLQALPEPRQQPFAPP